MDYYQSTSCHFSHTKPLAHAAFWFSTLALLFHANRSLVGYETKVNSKYAVKISMCTTLENFWQYHIFCVRAIPKKESTKSMVCTLQVNYHLAYILQAQLAIHKESLHIEPQVMKWVVGLYKGGISAIGLKFLPNRHARLFINLTHQSIPPKSNLNSKL